MAALTRSFSVTSLSLSLSLFSSLFVYLDTAALLIHLLRFFSVLLPPLPLPLIISVKHRLSYSSLDPRSLPSFIPLNSLSLSPSFIYFCHHLFSQTPKHIIDSLSLFRYHTHILYPFFTSLKHSILSIHPSIHPLIYLSIRRSIHPFTSLSSSSLSLSVYIQHDVYVCTMYITSTILYLSICVIYHSHTPLYSLSLFLSLYLSLFPPLPSLIPFLYLSRLSFSPPSLSGSLHLISLS